MPAVPICIVALYFLMPPMPPLPFPCPRTLHMPPPSCPPMPAPPSAPVHQLLLGSIQGSPSPGVPLQVGGGEDLHLVCPWREGAWEGHAEPMCPVATPYPLLSRTGPVAIGPIGSA